MKEDNSKGSPSKQENMALQIAITYGYIVLWIALSAGVILINKYVLAVSGFPFPLALTLTHMAFCSLLAFGLIKFGVCETANLDSNTYMRCVLPIAALFAVTLWCSNAAYLYLSVAFIQMMKALMPAAVYIAGCFMGIEKYSHDYALNMVVVTIGVAAASYGELNFDLLGVFFQGTSIATESSRLVLIQILLQQRGIKLNPITTLYYIAPACFVFLLLPFCFLELPKLMNPDTHWVLNPMLLLGSAASAFALNMAVFLLIGKSSALTMNIAGVIKDWLLILLSVMIFSSPVTAIQLAGYGVAFGGVCWYNYLKYKAMNAPKERLPESQALLAKQGFEAKS